MSENINLPWVEKYRPTKLNELISHDDIISTINKFLEDGRLPHLLFYGPPGTGKTSTIMSIAKKLYTPREFGTMVLELNASDDRGIDIVRNQILSFAGTKSIFKQGFKLIILDEADAMTQDAQNALRRIIEKYTENARFCLICNYLSKIIPALQSRCTRFRFGPLQASQIMPRLDHVIQSENVKIDEPAKKALIELARGDMRKVLNLLQSCSMAFDEIDESKVYQCCGQPLKSDIKAILKALLSYPFNQAYTKVLNLQREKGLALYDIITRVHLLVHKIDLPVNIKLKVLDQMADIEYQLTAGANEKIQLASFVATFQDARNHA